MTESLRMPPFWSGLSARLLALTILFVMIAEVLIFAPSVGRFRLDYLDQRLASAHLAILALEATPDLMVNDALAADLLSHVPAYSVSLRRPGDDLTLMLERPAPALPVVAINLTDPGPLELVWGAVVTLVAGQDRLIRLRGWSPKQPDVWVEVMIAEAPLRDALRAFGLRIFGLSIVIAVITAGLVYFALHWLLVRPMRRLTENMILFRDDPEDATRVIRPSGRADEVGVAERELQALQTALRASLHRKTRLATVGAGVTKINHDLRNLLATAQLVSDHLGRSGDRRVQDALPRLVAALDKAIELCGLTLRFTREGPLPLELTTVALDDLLAAVGKALPEADANSWHVSGDQGVTLAADPAQLHRILYNLALNARQAGARRLDIRVVQTPEEVRIEVADDGPGLPKPVRERLFEPFAGTARSQGAGLGLAIARELARAHGGDLRLVATGATGTAFLLSLPRKASQGARRALAAGGRAGYIDRA